MHREVWMAFSTRDNQSPYIRLYCTKSNWISGFVHTKGTQKVNAKISYFLSMKEFKINILLPTLKNCTSINHDDVSYQKYGLCLCTREQECIPVGCVQSAAVAVGGDGSAAVHAEIHTPIPL